MNRTNLKALTVWTERTYQEKVLCLCAAGDNLIYNKPALLKSRIN